MVTRMLLKLRPDVSCTTSGCIFYCVGTHPMLRRDAISTASGEISTASGEISTASGEILRKKQGNQLICKRLRKSFA